MDAWKVLPKGGVDVGRGEGALRHGGGEERVGTVAQKGQSVPGEEQDRETGWSRERCHRCRSEERVGVRGCGVLAANKVDEVRNE